MSGSSRIPQTLVPPPKGWPRLLQRRDAESRALMPLAALTSALAVLILVLTWPQRQPIELNLSGARLLGQHSRGTSVQLLDSRKTVELPSSDPNVRVYRIYPVTPGGTF
jgi:hypothetical protein